MMTMNVGMITVTVAMAMAISTTDVLVILVTAPPTTRGVNGNKRLLVFDATANIIRH